LKDAVKPARQKRSARTRDRILEALARGLEDDAPDRLTVGDIAARAGASVGAFYGRFADKDAALAALYAQRREGFLAALTAAGEEAQDLDDWARQAAALALDHAVANRALLARAASHEPPPATLYDDARVADPALIGLLARRLSARFALQITPAEASGAAAFALALIGAMARDAAVYSGALLASPKTRAWFVGEIARAAGAYLRSAAQPSPPASGLHA
jgi:AcrR family transcriptional regulator